MANYKKYYLYFHIRLDKNEVFYVGIGSKYTASDEYSRSKVLKKRNNIWNKIYKKCNQNIEIKIIREFETIEESFIEEKFWINHFGRLYNNTGILANIADGGQSSSIPAKEILQYDLNGNFIKKWDSVNQIVSEVNVSVKAIYNCLDSSKEVESSAGYMWKWNEKNYTLKIKPYMNKKGLKIHQFNKDGTYIKTYKSVREAGKAIGTDHSPIFHCLTGKRQSVGGYCWSTSLDFTSPFNKNIQMYSLDNELIEEFFTLADAIRYIGISSSTAIRNCFNGKQKQAYGYKWKKIN